VFLKIFKYEKNKLFFNISNKKMSSPTSALKQIADAAASPVRAASPKTEVIIMTDGPGFMSQLCSRVLWTYLILGLVLLAVVFYFYATAQADVAKYIGTRPSGVPGFVDNDWFTYVVISIGGVLFAYGMYRGYMAAGSESARNMLNLVFVVIAVLIIIWYYQFYRNGKLNANIDENTGYANRTCFFIAVALLVLLVLQFFLLWRTGDRLAAYTVVPLLVVISLFTWASWELSTGTTEF
jgi:hypothetical protein